MPKTAKRRSLRLKPRRGAPIKSNKHKSVSASCVCVCVSGFVCVWLWVYAIYACGFAAFYESALLIRSLAVYSCKRRRLRLGRRCGPQASSSEWQAARGRQRFLICIKINKNTCLAHAPLGTKLGVVHNSILSRTNFYSSTAGVDFK